MHSQDETQPQSGQRGNLLWQGVDFRIPIWGVAGAAMTVVWALVSAHFGQQQLAKDMAAVQAIVVQGQKETNTQFAQLALQASSSNVDVAELRIRIANVEASINRLYGQSAAEAAARAGAKVNR